MYQQNMQWIMSNVCFVMLLQRDLDEGLPDGGSVAHSHQQPKGDWRRGLPPTGRNRC
jgi:hypothetical protein